MRQIKTAIIGYGAAGKKFHAYLVGREKGLELLGVVGGIRRRRRAVSRDLKVRAYESVEEMLGDEEVELTVIATPHATHAAWQCNV